MKEVWLVYVVYQYDGLESIEVYGTKETACSEANKLIADFKQCGYKVNSGFDDIKFAEDIEGNCDYIVLENYDGEVEITVVKKLVR